MRLSASAFSSRATLAFSLLDDGSPVSLFASPPCAATTQCTMLPFGIDNRRAASPRVSPYSNTIFTASAFISAVYCLLSLICPLSCPTEPTDLVYRIR